MVYVAKNTDEEKLGDAPMDQLSPKFMLVIGLVGSVMTVCTLGFVVLLWLVMR